MLVYPRCAKYGVKSKPLDSRFNEAANKCPSLICHLTCIPFKVTSPRTNRSDLTTLTGHHIFEDVSYHWVWIINIHINFLCFPDGQLRKIDPNTGGPGSESFEFNVSENEDYNQKRYEALGDVSVTTENTYIYVQSQRFLFFHWIHTSSGAQWAT